MFKETKMLQKLLKDKVTAHMNHQIKEEKNHNIEQNTNYKVHLII